MHSLYIFSCTVYSNVDSTKPQEAFQQKKSPKMGLLPSFLVMHTSFSNDGGGGEKVLWCIIKALTEETKD